MSTEEEILNFLSEVDMKLLDRVVLRKVSMWILQTIGMTVSPDLIRGALEFVAGGCVLSSEDTSESDTDDSPSDL